MFSFTTPAWESNDSGDKWHKEVFEGKKASKGKLPSKKVNNKLQKLIQNKNNPKKSSQLQKNKKQHNTAELKINKVWKKNKQKEGQAAPKVHANISKPRTVFPERKEYPLKKSNKIAPTPQLTKTNDKPTQFRSPTTKKRDKVRPIKVMQNSLQNLTQKSSANRKVDICNSGVKSSQLQKNKRQHNTSELKINDKLWKKNKAKEGQTASKVHANISKPRPIFPEQKKYPLKKSKKVAPTPHLTKTNDKPTPIINPNTKKQDKVRPAKVTQNSLQGIKQKSTGSTKVDIYNLGVSRKNKLKMSLRERMMEKLKSSRFRYLNEQIYTTDGKSACNLFKNDREAFLAYHDGYKQQASKWPMNPLEMIIRSIKKMPADRIIADMGCGDAKLAESVPQKVYSFDLVAVNDRITESEMSNVPLEKGSVDVVIFCLSLMGTNIQDFIYEANRILKDGGILKIAEVESRFDKAETFIKGIEHFGFKITWKDLSQKLFYFFDFKKVGNCKQKSKLSSISLLPCIYKKR